jgi:hypothetical protein
MMRSGWWAPVVGAIMGPAARCTRPQVRSLTPGGVRRRHPLEVAPGRTIVELAVLRESSTRAAFRGSLADPGSRSRAYRVLD